MSVLDDFARIRFYRERASEFDLLADAEQSTSVRFRFRIIARHYRDLAEREEQADKVRMVERLKQLKLQREEAAKKSAPSIYLIAAE